MAELTPCSPAVAIHSPVYDPLHGWTAIIITSSASNMLPFYTTGRLLRQQ